MAVEEVHVRVRRQLEEAFGVESATYLMDRPPGGWSDLVTRETLHLELQALRAEMEVLRHELRSEMSELRGELRSEMSALSASVDRRLRAQTWMLMVAVAGAVTLSTTVTAALTG